MLTKILYSNWKLTIIDKTLMLCPDCKGYSVIIKDGRKQCLASSCQFIQFHVISYENQNRNFYAENSVENRFNQSQSNYSNKSYSVDACFQTIKKLVRDMEVSISLQQKAKSNANQILQIKYSTDNDGNNQGETKQKKQYKIQISDQHIGAYSLWLAFCSKNMQFKDVRIANEMSLTKMQWLQITSKMKEKISKKSDMEIPKDDVARAIRRVCRKRKIGSHQEQAMLKMQKQICKAGLSGSRKSVTVAALIFWQIMSRSSRYNKDGTFKIQDYLYCKKQSENQKRIMKIQRPKEEQSGKQEIVYYYWTQNRFDISLEAVVKYRKEFQKKGKKSETVEDKINGHSIQQFIPDFQTRIPAKQKTEN